MSSHALLVLSLYFLLNLLSFGSGINVNILLNGMLQYYDLSHQYDDNTPNWPGDLKFSLKKNHAEEISNGVWFAMNEFCSSEHSGTHIDAPYHFNRNGWKVGQIPLENLIASLHVIDLRSIVAGNPDFVLEKRHIDTLCLDPKKRHVVIFKFGWSQYYGSTKYFGAENPMEDNLRFPGLGEEVSNWLASSFPQIVGVGVDVPSIDPGSEYSTFPAHRAFTSHNIYILENIKLDVPLPWNGCAVMVMPMKIQEGSGAPTRITAFCPK